MTRDRHSGFDFSNLNRLWADLIVEELVRSGVRMFCLSPGSRSAPLATAVAAHPDAPHIMHFDERGSAFYALGFGRATGRPAAWITTSGTAVANGMPAVVEASTDNVPMLLLTADRPPELRDTGANQTIDQVKLFGDYVRWHFDLPTPSRSIPPEAVLTTVDQAVYRSRRMPCGPVHLNCMFREPLAPEPDGGDYRDYMVDLAAWQDGPDPRRPYTAYAHGSVTPSEEEIRRFAASVDGVERGLIIAGRLASPAQGDAVRWLAERLGWPLLADAASQIRLGETEDEHERIPFYDLLLVSEHFRSAHAPDAVLIFGGRPTSKRLIRFITESSAEIVAVVREAPSRMDPHHHATVFIESDIVTFCRRMADHVERRTTSDPLVPSIWLTAWRSASVTAHGVIRERLSESDALSEPAVAHVVSASAAHGLFMANSMPVRDVDSYGYGRGHAPMVGANRGASGIDGTVACAVGFARGLRRAVTLLIGDLALLHDLNSLALAARATHPLTIVVINNRGGGIFSFLPIAKHADVFETYFGTPHPYSFEHAAAMFGLQYAAPSSLSELREMLTHTARDSRLIEVATDREKNVRLHRELEQQVAEALDTAPDLRTRSN